MMSIELNGPATLEAVVTAVVKLSNYDEAELLNLVSVGKLAELFPFAPYGEQESIPAFADDEEIVVASALPLDPAARRDLIQSSMPKQGQGAQGRNLPVELFTDEEEGKQEASFYHATLSSSER